MALAISLFSIVKKKKEKKKKNSELDFFHLFKSHSNQTKKKTSNPLLTELIITAEIKYWNLNLKQIWFSQFEKLALY